MRGKVIMGRGGTAFRVGLIGIGTITLIGTVQAVATPSHPLHRVTICHATNSVSNPYVRLTVDEAAVNGHDGPDNGRGDHLLNHTGPVFDAANPAAGWGDIIPPFYSDGATPTGYASANWDVAGQAFFATGCGVAEESTDVCPNIEGDQSVIPEGYYLDEQGFCVPE
ncbi:MAG: hypothetical protein ACXWYJ_06925 [Actinomycetota bacterium]